MTRWLGLLLTTWLFATGCVTHLAPNPMGKHRYETLDWIGPLEDAQALGQELDRPVLMILAAGSRTGLC